MSYDKNEILEKAKALCQDKEKNVLFIEDLITYLPCAKATFYLLFPYGSDELDIIKELIEANRVVTKSAIRAKLFNGKGGGMGFLALYKLICSDEERKALSMTHIDHTTKGKSIASQPLSKEDYQQLDDELESEY